MSPDLIAQAAFGFQNDQAIEALDFLKTASDFPALEDTRSSPPGLAPAIMKAAAYDSARVENWLESNRDSAFFSKAASLYGSHLLNIGDTEGARKWQALSEE